MTASGKTAQRSHTTTGVQLGKEDSNGLVKDCNISVLAMEIAQFHPDINMNYGAKKREYSYTDLSASSCK